LLIVLAADLLQSILNQVADTGLLHHPLSNCFGGDFPIVCTVRGWYSFLSPCWC
jgi:hypothetical protein